jgi:TRAP-type transport system periplasmic protein
MNLAAFAPVVSAAQISSLGFAFNSSKQALAAMDGSLGAYVRKEFASKGLYVFDKAFQTGFREVTSSLRPIKTVDDFSGFKIRTIPAPIYVDLFRAFGASPVPLEASEMYTALQTHVVDGQETSYGGIEETRVYEVQKYLSATDHIWSGYFLAANGEGWSALPPDIQDVIKRNAGKYLLRLRADMQLLNDSLVEKLKRQGLIFNAADMTSARARLGPYYGRWKNEFGGTAWSLLESYSGRLG